MIKGLDKNQIQEIFKIKKVEKSSDKPNSTEEIKKEPTEQELMNLYWIEEDWDYDWWSGWYKWENWSFGTIEEAVMDKYWIKKINWANWAVIFKDLETWALSTNKTIKEVIMKKNWLIYDDNKKEYFYKTDDWRESWYSTINEALDLNSY